MSKRRFAPPLLAAILLTGVSVGWRWAADRPEAPALSAAVAGNLLPSRNASPATVRTVEFWQPAAVATVKGSAPLILSADAAATVAEVVALQLLAQGSDLELSARQWSALAAVTAEIQAVRHAYEASIAVATAREPGRGRIEIPAYAAAGDALRARFHAGLREQLGDANAAEILERLGARLEGYFAGFGVSVQTLEVSGALAELAVTRTIKFWNSVEGEDRLTTRRETHFPSHEDPSGDNWGSLLSVLSARAAGQKGS